MEGQTVIIEDSERGRLQLDLSEDGDITIGTWSPAVGWVTVRFCTVGGGDPRQESEVIRESIRDLIRELAP